MTFLQVLLFAKKSYACDDAKSGGAQPSRAAATPQSTATPRSRRNPAQPRRGEAGFAAQQPCPWRNCINTGRAAAHREPRSRYSAACRNAASYRFLRAARRHPRRRQRRVVGLDNTYYHE